MCWSTSPGTKNETSFAGLIYTVQENKNMQSVIASVDFKKRTVENSVYPLIYVCVDGTSEPVAGDVSSVKEIGKELAERINTTITRFNDVHNHLSKRKAWIFTSPDHESEGIAFSSYETEKDKDRCMALKNIMIQSKHGANDRMFCLITALSAFTPIALWDVGILFLWFLCAFLACVVYITWRELQSREDSSDNMLSMRTYESHCIQLFISDENMRLRQEGGEYMAWRYIHDVCELFMVIDICETLK